jgi:hypothetical protein
MATTNPQINCMTMPSSWYRLLFSWIGYRYSADIEIVLFYGTQIFIAMLTEVNF